MPARIGVLTSGGDAQGMNAAVRAIVRTAIQRDTEVFAIREGWLGAVEGGDNILRMGWSDVSGILNKGGTVIGTARCLSFLEASGRRKAVRNLIERGIDRVIVIGGDGSLTGTALLQTEWPKHVADLLSAGEISETQARRHSYLYIVGLVGSIDNDMVGTDMTIGTDSALHRITEAIDAICSTAESHQRTFIVEVMGRRCGYLAVMSAVAGGADYTFFPEVPPENGWEDRLVELLAKGRAAGRRDSIVVVAEGATDRDGGPITAQRISEAIQERTGGDARVTILGHVQRGGKPSAYDRWMATVCGVEAVNQVLKVCDGAEPVLVGVRRDAVIALPLLAAVENTQKVADYIAAGDYDSSVRTRGPGFQSMIDIYRGMTEFQSSVSEAGEGKRIAIMHAGALAPGMNQLARVAVRSGIDLGYEMFAIQGGVPGLMKGDFSQWSWSDVEGMAHTGGADLGTRRHVPEESDLYAMARQLEEHSIEALVVMGGFHAYATIALLERERHRYPAFDIPIAVIPASIDNNLPGWPMAVGADTALNTVVDSIDMLRMSASASKRAFIVETMGRGCGFLPLVGGIAAGAEKSYLPELGINLSDLEDDIAALVDAFDTGRKFYLAVIGENASEYYTANTLRRLFEAEGRGMFTVREAVIGHVQQGGTPSPFDRINATRLAHNALVHLDRQLKEKTSHYSAACRDAEGLFASFRDVTDQMDWENQRPSQQWWMDMRPVFLQLSRRPGQQ